MGQFFFLCVHYVWYIYNYVWLLNKKCTSGFQYRLRPPLRGFHVTLLLFSPHTSLTLTHTHSHTLTHTHTHSLSLSRSFTYCKIYPPTKPCPRGSCACEGCSGCGAHRDQPIRQNLPKQGHTYIYIYINVCVYVYIYIFKCVCLCIYIYKCVCLCSC